MTHNRDTDPEVMGVVDPTGDVPRFVIADISCDGAWLSVPEVESVAPEAWE